MKHVLSLLLLFCSLPSLAQIGYNVQKLSSYLRDLMNEHSIAASRGRQIPEKTVCTLMKVCGDIPASDVVGRYGCQVLDSIGGIYFVQVPVNQLGNLSLDDSVLRIEAHEMPRVTMNEVPSLVGADKAWQGIGLAQAFTGKDVVSGIVDFGFDFTHPMFFDSDGHIRICRYYDMCSTSDEGEKGVAYDEEGITTNHHSALATSQTHGTHTASVMAGSLVRGEKAAFSGIAPKSDIVVAEIGMAMTVDLHGQVIAGDLKNNPDGTSANFILSIKRIFDYADEENKPCVVNFSGGLHLPINDPCILENEAIDAIIGPGHIIVASAGNDGGLPTTMTKSEDVYCVTAGFNGTSNRQSQLTQYQADYIDLYLVTEKEQNVSFILGEDQYGKVVNMNTSYFEGDTILIAEEYNKDTLCIEAYRERTPPSFIKGNLYHFTLHMLFADDGWRNLSHWLYYHNGFLTTTGIRVMIWGDNPCEMYTNPMYTPFISAETLYTGKWSNCLSYLHTIGWPAEEENVIAVGSLKTRTYLADFSSKGPAWSGQVKPEVVAPGVGIIGAYNDFYANSENNQSMFYDKLMDYNGIEHHLWPMDGTSTSSPIVAGAIALWLEAKPDLTPSDIKDVLAHTCRHIDDDRIDGYPNNMYGYGEIDAYAGLLYILGIEDKIQGLSKNQPTSVRIKLDGRTLMVVETETGVPFDSDIKLTVYSIDGRVVLSGNHSKLNLSNLPKGIYVVQIDTRLPTATGSTLIRL